MGKCVKLKFVTNEGRQGSWALSGLPLSEWHLVAQEENVVALVIFWSWEK